MIVIPALHPAHDVIVRVDGLEPGRVQRVGVGAMATGAGGKAVNVALAIAAMEVPVRLVACGDAAIHDGLLAHAARHPHLELIAIPSPVATRTDIAIVDGGGRLTVINGTAADPGPDVIDAVVDRTLDGLAERDVVVLSGSTPDRTGAAHAEIAVAAQDRGGRVVVDASGPALHALLETQPAAVKISADEADELMRSGDTALDRGRPPTLAAVPIVGITDGAGGLRAWLPDGRAVRVTPPPNLPVVATLGAGDAVTAGLAIAMANGDDPLDGFILGTALAASTLDHLGPSVDRVAADRLRAGVHVSPLRPRR
ncbi:MAG TPA: PfkB family carbohydrate kinase [Candidatus Limnocylindrales bacterium]|nr:PfkB family carbohydrate kinase [Candidatus Limnocylindrales bacterium]